MQHLCRRSTVSLALFLVLISPIPTPVLAEESVAPVTQIPITEPVASIPPVEIPSPPSAVDIPPVPVPDLTPILELPATPTTTEPATPPSPPPSPPPIPEPAPNPEPAPPASPDPLPPSNPAVEIHYIYLPCSTSTIPEPVNEAVSSTLPVPPPPVIPIPPPPAPRIFLNEIDPAPSTGDEWVELASDLPIPLASLDGWTIEDSSHVIFRFRNDTQSQIHQSADGRYLLVSFKSAVLNNTGDAIILKNAEEAVVDQWTYAKTSKDHGWARTPDLAGPWMEELETTPLAANPQTITIEVATTTLAAAIELDPTPVTALTPTTTPTPLPKPKPTPSKPKAPVPIAAKPAATIKTVTKKPTVAKAPAPKKPKATIALKPKKMTKPKAAKPKPTPAKPAAKQDPPPLSTSIDMLDSLGSSVRVTLAGIVGSVRGLLGTNQFVLQTEDGRGLLVQGNGKQPSPPFLSLVRVSGTLITNDAGTSLRLASLDRWTEEASGTRQVSPRVVDLLVPGHEDAWSLVETTGTVRSVKSTSILLDLDGLDMPVQIRPVIRYRAERLKPGDTVRIRGLLDTRSDVPRLIPRSADDIDILVHAKLASAKPLPTPVPEWLPFGAAGVTIAAAEGYKRVKKIIERRKLERVLLETAPATPPIERQSN